MKSSWVARLAVAASLLGTTASAQDDVVKPRSGEQLVGKLKTEDYAGLQITVKNKAVDVAWKDVESVTYLDEAVIAPVHAAMDSGDLDGAAAKLLEITDGKKGRKVLRQRALFLLATAFFRKGVNDQAETVVQQLRSEFPTGRYAADIVRLEVDAAIGRKDQGAATAAIERAMREGKTAGLPPAFELELGLFGARVTEAAGNLEQAAAKYRDLVSKAGQDESIASEARLGQAHCDQATGRADQAEVTYREVAMKDIHPRRLAMACNGIADIQLDKGSKTRDDAALLDSAYFYLRGSVLYTGQPGEAEAELARSLAGAARAFSLLADIQTDEALKTLYRQRSADQWNELRVKMPEAPQLASAPGAAPAAAPAGGAPAKPAEDKKTPDKPDGK